MAKEVSVNGLSELLARLDSLKKENDVYILFTGSKDSSGNSWCPDCNDGRTSQDLNDSNYTFLIVVFKKIDPKHSS